MVGQVSSQLNVQEMSRDENSGIFCESDSPSRSMYRLVAGGGYQGRWKMEAVAGTASVADLPGRFTGRCSSASGRQDVCEVE